MHREIYAYDDLDETYSENSFATESSPRSVKGNRLEDELPLMKISLTSNVPNRVWKQVSHRSEKNIERFKNQFSEGEWVLDLETRRFVCRLNRHYKSFSKWLDFVSVSDIAIGGTADLFDHVRRTFMIGRKHTLESKVLFARLRVYNSFVKSLTYSDCMTCEIR